MPRIAASALAALLVTAWTQRVQAQAEEAIREITIRASAVLPDRVQDAIDAVAVPEARGLGDRCRRGAEDVVEDRSFHGANVDGGGERIEDHVVFDGEMGPARAAALAR